MWTTEDRQRQRTLTTAFMEKRHTLWHQYNGADAACENCGTTGGPAWLRRQIAKDLTRTVVA
jgi:hypothetical protein